MSGKYLIVVGGPTAVGKTAFSIALAKALQTVILSADSRQLYKDLTIGTAKPSAEELQAARHYFIDILPPDQAYDAGQFEKDALALLDKLFQEHDTVVVAGGSGLYVKALCEGFDHMPEVPQGIREQLNKELEQKGLDPLLTELQTVDEPYYQQVDRQNPQRIIRALEVYRASGKPYSFYRKDEKIKRPFNIIKIGLERNRKELYQRINLRIDQMIAEGLEDEARSLYPYRTLNALQTVGYQEWFAYFEGEYDYEEAVRLLKRNSRRYAKRQLTWFKRDAGFTWFHPNQLAQALRFIRKQSGDLK